MKSLTGIVAATALSLAAGAKADEQAEDSVVRHANISYSVGYLGGYAFPDSGSLEGFKVSAHFVPYEFFDGVLNLGIDIEGAAYAFLREDGGAAVMLQQKVDVGFEAQTDVVHPFAYLGLGFSEVDMGRGYLNFCQGIDLNFGQENEVAPYVGLEQGWLFSMDEWGYYALLNIGLKI